MQDIEIFPTSAQWTYVQFRLQLILSHPNIELLSVNKNASKLNSQSLQSFFKIDAALDLTNSDQKQIWRLKANQQKGVIFKCGRIQQPINYEDSLGKQKIYKVVMFKIAVNQLYPIVKSQNLSTDDLISFTQKYDSIYLCHQSQQMTVYQHQYILRSTKQYLWQYEVHYKYINPIQSTGAQFQNKISKWNPQSIKCEQCQERKAIFYCLQEKELFCTNCFDQNHKGKNRISHRKQLITPFNCHKKCPKATHAGNLLQFYCFNCKQLKCQKCLNDNVHFVQSIKEISANQKGSRTKIMDQSMTQKRKNHQSIAVMELAKLFKQKEEQLNEQIKLKLSNKIRQIQMLINSVKVHFSMKLQQIEQKLRQQILALKEESTLHMNKAVGLHTELKRKYDQFLWIQKFVQYNEEVLDAQSNIKLKEAFASYVQFINAQDYFVQVDKKIVGMKTFF